MLARERADQWDAYRPLSALRVEIRDPLAPLPARYQLVADRALSQVPIELAPHAMGQLAGLAGIPTSFFEKVPPALGLKLLRCMLDLNAGDPDRAVLLRLAAHPVPRLRAVLPQSYTRLDDADVLTQVETAADQAGLSVARARITDDLFHLRLVASTPVELGHAGYPDPAWPGLDVRTSETGAHALEVRHLLFRLVCENGMTQMTADVRRIRARNTRVDLARFREVLGAAIDGLEAFGNDTAARLRETRRVHVSDPLGEAEELFRRFRLGSFQGKLGRWVAAELLKRNTLLGVQRFDVVQAFTAVARGLDAETAARFEDAMGAWLMEEVA
jgi:hypothetical protein